MVTGLYMADESLATGKNKLPTAPTEGTPSNDLNFGSTEQSINSQSTQFIKNWETAITSLSGNIVNVKGSTDSYSSVDTIAVDLYLQYWDNAQSKWIDLAHVGEFKAVNAVRITGSDDVAVSSGFYYRTRGLHYVIENGTVEQINSVSAYIYMD